MREGKKLNKKQFSSRLRNKFNVADSDNFLLFMVQKRLQWLTFVLPRNDCLCSCCTKQLNVAKNSFSDLNLKHSEIITASSTKANNGNSANWNIIRCFYYWREARNSKPFEILVWDERIINSRCRILQTNLNQFVAFGRILSEVVTRGDL